MEAKTNELTGAALDWAVAKCEGADVVIESVKEQADKFNSVLLCDGSKPSEDSIKAVISSLKPILRFRGSHDIHLVRVPAYSSDWAHAGPIIERENISTRSPKPHYQKWSAFTSSWNGGSGHAENYTQFGPTPLIAAMRCYVASKLGDEVEVPDELTTGAAS